MGKEINELLFALIKSSIRDTYLDEIYVSSYSQEMLPELLNIAKKYDVEHLLVLGLKKNALVENSDLKTIKIMHKAVLRYEKLIVDYEKLCSALEDGGIQFVPLKGSVLRKYYPEEWMRTSCDIDILVRNDDVDKAIKHLVNTLGYEEKERQTHDVSLYSQLGNHIELHFDLLEEERANNANSLLSSVWENVTLCKDSKFCYEMSDAFFYFYHIAHMAKHFEIGGCGISPFIDLFILDNMTDVDKELRDKILKDGDLLDFANAVRKLSMVWFGDEKEDELSLRIQTFVLNGGVYGSADNRVAHIRQKKRGYFEYIISRIFVPFERLKRYYPVLEKYPFLMPVMQVRRWFMLLNPDIAKMAKNEIKISKNMKKEKIDEINDFFCDIGLK